MTHEECEAGVIRDKKIREMRAGGMKLAAIAEIFGLSQPRISQICPTIVKEAVPRRYVTVYISYEIVDALKAFAKKEKSSVSSIVKAAISDCLKKKK